MPNPVALVTGAAHGLGLEVARQLASTGVDVLIAARDGSKARVAAENLEGVMALPFGLDVAEPKSVATTATAITKDPGRLDILINNAAAYVEWTEES
jgi:NAD(P)-dependent dehydrogenase (short-subunit alcohol dehydrogenase family)